MARRAKLTEGAAGHQAEGRRGRRLTDAQCRNFSHTRSSIDWGWLPDPWRFVRCGWVPGKRRLFLFQELSANRKTPQETRALVAQALTFADEPLKNAYQHDELIRCGDPPDGKRLMAVYRREPGLRVRPARKSNMRRLKLRVLRGCERSSSTLSAARSPTRSSG